MVDVIDHMPLICPIRSASNLVKRSLGPNFERIKISDLNAEWTTPLLKGIENGEYYGITIPSILTSIVYTNDLLRTAGAYHELKGHIETMMKMARSRTSSLSFHAGLLTKDKLFGIGNAVYQAASSNFQRCTQELMGTTKEISSLIPYQEKYRSLVKNRIENLKNLNQEGEWICDQEICYHRNAMYLSDLLKDRLGLTATSLVKLVYGFFFDVKPGAPFLELKIMVDPDWVLKSLADNYQEIEKDGFSSIPFFVERTIRKMPSTGMEVSYLPHLSRVKKIESQDRLFSEKTSVLAKGVYSKDHELSVLFGFPQMRELITKSFFVITKNDVELYYKKGIVSDSSLDRLLIKTFVCIRIASLYAYPFVADAFNINYLRCPSRNGSQCNFRKQKEFPHMTIFDSDSVHKKIVNDNLCNIALENARASLAELFRTLRRKKKLVNYCQ